MADIDNSVFEKNNQLNRKLLVDSWNVLKSKRADGDTTKYQEKFKNEAKKFDFFRWILKKTNKIGRFGAKRVKERDDVIKNMDNDAAPNGVYFDPLGLKLITNRTLRAVGGADEASLNSFKAEAKEIHKAFIDRTGDEIENTRNNDFDRHLLGDENLNIGEILQLQQDESKKDDKSVLDMAEDMFDAGRAFEPDERIIEDVPNAFSLEVMVDDPPPKYKLEWEKYKAEQTKGFGAIMKGIFRKIFKVKAPTENKLLEDFTKSLPEYKRIESQGKREAKEAGLKFDPENYNPLDAFRAEIQDLLEVKTYGHSVVRFNALRDGRKLSRYSFMFCSIGDGGMAGATIGNVGNPVQKHEMISRVGTEFKLSYPNFLRAAAKVRGVAGSMRTYSFMRYNCTSFVAEIAEAAGIPIKAEDTSTVLMSHRHRATRVDNPYLLAKFIQKENKKKFEEKGLSPQEYEENTDYQGEFNNPEKNDENIKEAVSNESLKIVHKYMDRIKESNIVQLMCKLELTTEANIKEGFSGFVSNILQEGMNVDKAIPIEGLTGTELDNALKQRENRKIGVIGARTEEEAIENFFSEKRQDVFEKTLFYRKITPKKLYDKLLVNSVYQMDGNRQRIAINKMAKSDLFKTEYDEATYEYKLGVAKYMMSKIEEWQTNKAKELVGGMDSLQGINLLIELNSRMKNFDMKLLGDEMFENGDDFEEYIYSIGLSLPNENEAMEIVKNISISVDDYD